MERNIERKYMGKMEYYVGRIVIGIGLIFLIPFLLAYLFSLWTAPPNP